MKDHRFNPAPVEDIYNMPAANAWIEEMIVTGQVPPDDDTPDDRGRINAMQEVNEDAWRGVECRYPSQVDCVLHYLETARELIQVHQKRPLRVVIEWEDGSGVGVPLRDRPEEF